MFLHSWIECGVLTTWIEFSYENRKLYRYNSRYSDYQSEAVDCFIQDWHETNNWLVPPINLVNMTIAHLLACNGHGTLIVPKWPSSAYWHILFETNYVKRGFVIDVIEFSSKQDIFIKTDTGIIGSRQFTSKVLAIRI